VSELSAQVLWLAALEEICSRAAHEIKGALNGVSVNLEVVRTRSEQGKTGDAVHRYAEAAARELTGVIALSEAVLALARPAKDPVEPGSTLRRLSVLLASTLRGDGRRLEITEPLDVDITTVSGTVVRLTLASALLAAVDGSPHVTCSAVGGEIRITCGGRSRTDLARDVCRIAEAHGVTLTDTGGEMRLVFPRKPS